MAEEFEINVAQESTSQEIKQAVRDIKAEVEATNGLVVANNGKKYRAVLDDKSGYFANMSNNFYDEINALLAEQQTSEPFPDSSYFVYKAIARPQGQIYFLFSYSKYAFILDPIAMEIKMTHVAGADNAGFSHIIAFAGSLRGPRYFYDDKYLYIMTHRSDNTNNFSFEVFDKVTLKYIKMTGSFTPVISLVNSIITELSGGIMQDGTTAFVFGVSGSNPYYYIQVLKDSNGIPTNLNYNSARNLMVTPGGYVIEAAFPTYEGDAIYTSEVAGSNHTMRKIVYNSAGTFTVLAQATPTGVSSSASDEVMHMTIVNGDRVAIKKASTSFYFFNLETFTIVATPPSGGGTYDFVRNQMIYRTTTAIPVQAFGTYITQIVFLEVYKNGTTIAVREIGVTTMELLPYMTTNSVMNESIQPYLLPHKAFALDGVIYSYMNNLHEGRRGTLIKNEKMSQIKGYKEVF